MDESLGPWEPLDLDAAVRLFQPAEFRWWVSGGHALELHSRRSWRGHDDTDISFCRSDAPKVRAVLHEWDIHVAAAGRLSPWTGNVPDADSDQNNLWARPSPDAPWALDMTISDGDRDRWIFRRNPTLTRPWDDAVLRASDNTPYLSPELQMLFKSKNVRPKDRVDAEEVIPKLTAAQRAFLVDVLPAGHEWQVLAARS